MYTKKVTIVNPSGLHARPASNFIACAKKFNSRLTAKRAQDDDKEINAKSIVLLLSKGFSKGDEVQFTATGDDEVVCIDTLVDLISSGFGEI